MLAFILLTGAVLHLCMMIIGPLVALRRRSTKEAVLYLIGFFAGYNLCIWAVPAAGAAFVNENWYNAIRVYGAWCAILIGLSIVVYSFIKLTPRHTNQ